MIPNRINPNDYTRPTIKANRRAERHTDRDRLARLAKRAAR